ncbi:MAG: hypothetical protein HY660_00880, partial [Armatimonadetes bacterium]|nr:hypothetical protein [Armatimonadota bacterium]
GDLKRGDIMILPVKGARQIVYPFYQTKKPFDDVRVRLALNLAVDRNKIVTSILQGYARPMHGPNFAPGTIGYDSTIPAYRYEPARAKDLLAKAGYPGGFEATWQISSGAFLKDREVAEAVAGQLRQIGVNLRLVVTERPKLVASFMSGDWAEISSTTWGTVKDPDVWLTWNTINRKSFVDQQTMDLLLKSKAAMNPKERENLLKRLNRHLHDHPVWLYVYAPDDLYAARKHTGWAPYALRGDLGYTYYWVPGRQ